MSDPNPPSDDAVSDAPDDPGPDAPEAGAAAADSPGQEVQEAGGAGQDGDRGTPAGRWEQEPVGIPSPPKASRPAPIRKSPWHYTDLAAASELLGRYGESFRYNYDRGTFMVYVAEEGRWAVDHTGHVRRCINQMSRDAWRLFRDGAVKTKAQFNWARRISSHAGTEAALSKVRHLTGVSIGSDLLDADPWLLNTKNCIIDLRDGHTTPHASELLISKLCPVEYNAIATCPRWLNFLTEITEAEEAMMIYLQRLVGHWLSADISSQKLWIFHGGGRNGKSVFLDTIQAMMGDYAVQAPETLITPGVNGSHSTDIAMLAGARLAVASETEAGAPMRMQLVKRLTGDTRLTARFMRMDNFSFNRTNKTVIVTNNRPALTELTEAVQRRIELVPFNFTVPTERQNPNLIAELRKEWAGILNWAIEGSIEAIRLGLSPPPPVVEASRAYISEQDDVADWIDARCTIHPDGFMTREEAFGSYTSWVGRGGVRLGRLPFYDRLRKRPGVEDNSRRISGEPRRGFSGIKLAQTGFGEAGGGGNGELY
jgi:putative DNA primase/helicase